jgi:Cu(I)/Ag(I) efflux system periplasmic protein CusF
MKITSTISLILILSASGLATAQSGGMNHAGMPGMQHGEMTKAEAGKNGQDDTQKAQAHQAIAIVRAVNPVKGSVTLAHEAIQSLHWSAMTMSFAVKDSKLFDKLAVGKKVNVELTKLGSDYVVTAVK